MGTKTAAQVAIELEQVEHIASMMLRSEWKGGASRDELAKEWGLHEKTIAQRAIAASLQLERKGQPIEELIGERIAELDNIKRRALEGDDFKAAIQAIKLIMDIRGVTTVRRGKEEPAPASHADLEKLSAQERIAMHKAAIAEEEAKLKGATH